MPRPNGWCPFSGTLWTHESTQVLWCSLVLGQGSTEGTISVKKRNKKGFDHNIGQGERHSELPRPNGWCPFSGNLWTHESTQVLWCSWVLGQGSSQGRSPWNSVKRSGLITILGKLNAIVNRRVPMADVHIRVPYGLMSPHRYFGVPES